MCLAGKVLGLKRFAHINTLGCIKISKKHDKHSNIPLKQVCRFINQLIMLIKSQRVLYPVETFCRSSWQGAPAHVVCVYVCMRVIVHVRIRF